MIDFIAYILVRGLNLLFAFLPVSFCLWLGRRAGVLAFTFNKKRRLIAYANLKAAFAKEKSPGELRKITKKVYQNMVQTFMEVLNLTKVNRRYVDRYVEVVNMERIRNAAKSGRGTILLTGHFGDWELSSLVSSVEGFPIMVLAREQKMKRLNELLNRLRESNGCTVIRKGMQTKNILKALYGKNIVGILSDQDAGRNGLFVDFFGRPTSCHSGAFEIAKHTDSLILPNFIVRTKGPCHKLYLEEYIDFRNTGSADDIKDNLQKFTRLLESYVRRYPEQWLWLHKRWKSTTLRTVLILNDGKAGHLNQSLAVAKQIQLARTTQGYGLDDTRIEIVDVKYRSSSRRTILTACAAFASWRCHGCMRCMRLCLDRASYRKLMSTYADFVVSCGSSLALANIFMAKENNARNIVLMRPNIFMGLRHFSLAVIPRHDRPPKRKNVVQTLLAPNLIDAEKMKSDGEKLQNRIGSLGGNVIGVFIGGENPEFEMRKDDIDVLLNNLLRFSAEANAEFLVTTSRRTPKRVEELLKRKVKREARCRLLVIANEDNFDEAVGGMLALANVHVVSEESVSMVSEAVSSLKPVIAFRLAPKKKHTKHEKILRALESERRLTLVSVQDVSDALKAALASNKTYGAIADNRNIHTAIRRLI